MEETKGGDSKTSQVKRENANELLEKFKSYIKTTVVLDKEAVERVKQIFEINDSGKITTQLEAVVTYPILAFIAGVLYGGRQGQVYARETYIAKTENKAFLTRREAFKEYRSFSGRYGARYGWRWGWRLALLTGSAFFVNTLLTAYRNEETVSNYMCAGAVAGGLYRFPGGLQGMAGGSILGCLYGIPIGLVAIYSIKLYNKYDLEKKLKPLSDRIDAKYKSFYKESTFEEQVAENFEESFQQFDTKMKELEKKKLEK